MFLDERIVLVRSGAGGDGIVSWRREARAPLGGPAGGNGGDGGHIDLIAEPGLATLGDMEQETTIAAEDGERGGRAKCSGKRGRDRLVPVPVGTTVYAARSGRLLADLVEPGQRVRVAKGGRGGHGNAHFATATDQAPSRCEKGGPGRTRTLRLELRLLADVGLIGAPNAGKSTLLRRVSRATPAVGSHPFTTLAPSLGIVSVGRERRIAFADLPGLVEGAHEGKGLGLRFLRHAERTRVLVHLVDPLPLDGSDPVETWRMVRRELAAHGAELAERPEVLVATKSDLYAPDGVLPADGPVREVLSRLAAAADRGVIPISAATGAGIDVLLKHVIRALDRLAPASPEPAPSSGSGPVGSEP